MSQVFGQMPMYMILLIHTVLYGRQYPPPILWIQHCGVAGVEEKYPPGWLGRCHVAPEMGRARERDALERAGGRGAFSLRDTADLPRHCLLLMPADKSRHTLRLLHGSDVLFPLLLLSSGMEFAVCINKQLGDC